MQAGLRRELEYFFGALRFFTRLPVPGWVGHSAETLNHSSRYFPLVGLLVGAIAGAVFLGAAAFFSTITALILSLAATVYLTGAFHEDGWTDTVDGLGGSFTRSRALEIMRDSRIGSFGSVALCLLLAAKLAALHELPKPLIAPALLAGHAFSRLCANALLRFLDYAREEGKAKPLATRLSSGELLFSALPAVAALFLLPPQAALAAAAGAVLATLFLANKFSRRLGGYTGDCLGATQQLAEVAFYLGAALAW